MEMFITIVAYYCVAQTPKYYLVHNLTNFIEPLPKVRVWAPTELSRRRS